MATLANEKKDNGAQLLEDEELDQATGAVHRPIYAQK